MFYRPLCVVINHRSIPNEARCSSTEQARLLKLLIDHVDYDGAAGTVAITFRPTGFKMLAAEKENACNP